MQTCVVKENAGREKPATPIRVIQNADTNVSLCTL